MGFVVNLATKIKNLLVLVSFLEKIGDFDVGKEIVAG